MTSIETRIFATPADIFRAAAEEFAQLASDAVQKDGKFSVVLSGGYTPKGLYDLLASGATPGIPWDRICFFWGDERHVPPDHADSNYRVAKEALLSKVPVRPENIFRIHAEEKDADVAAKNYEQEIRKSFHLSPGDFPRFDLTLLGLGPDGHTASLFPGTTALQEQNRLVVANWVEKFNAHRITLTLPVLNHSRVVLFLVSGKEKAAALKQIFSKEASDLPAKLVRPDGKLLWFVDEDAAMGLPSGEGRKY